MRPIKIFNQWFVEIKCFNEKVKLKPMQSEEEAWAWCDKFADQKGMIC